MTEPANTGEGCWIPAKLPEDATADSEDDDRWLIAERMASGEKNIVE